MIRFAIAILLFAPALAAAEAKNVLLLIADDLGREKPGAGPSISTNIDRLAARGARFDYAFATTASCSACRSVIYTGLHNHTNGQLGHATIPGFQQYPHIEPIFLLLRRQGYRVGMVGKKHVLPESLYPTDFQPAVDARDAVTMAKLAESFMTSPDEKPFFLSVGFSEPHRVSLGWPIPPFSGLEHVKYDPDQITVPPHLPDQPATRQELADYFAAAHRLDQGVGMLLDALERSGKRDSTLVIFVADNGIPFPNAKTNCYDTGVRLPCVVSKPGMKRVGHVNQAMIAYYDIVPTILEWTGRKGPNYRLFGRSFLNIVDEEDPKGWDEVYLGHTYHEATMYYPVRGVRTRTHKYLWNIASPLTFPHASDLYNSATWQNVLAKNLTRYGNRTVEQYLHRDAVELYDLRNDPQELKNVASDPAVAAVKAELAAKVKAFQERSRDPWLVRYKY